MLPSLSSVAHQVKNWKRCHNNAITHRSLTDQIIITSNFCSSNQMSNATQTQIINTKMTICTHQQKHVTAASLGTSSTAVRCSVTGRLRSCVQNRRNSSCIMLSIMRSSSTSCELKCLPQSRHSPHLQHVKSPQMR